MAYSLDALSDDCYPDTSVLVNKYDIRDERQLADVETFIVSTKAAQLELAPLPEILDFNYYKSVHHFLFFDLYGWAGQVRTVDFSKQGTQFCPAVQIEERAALIFGRLQQKNYFKGYSFREYMSEFVDFYCATNELHPFREGNGRTQRVFLTNWIRSIGYDIDFSDIDGDLLMVATIQAASGVTDLLYEIFSEAIHQ